MRTFNEKYQFALDMITMIESDLIYCKKRGYRTIDETMITKEGRWFVKDERQSEDNLFELSLSDLESKGARVVAQELAEFLEI